MLVIKLSQYTTHFLAIVFCIGCSQSQQKDLSFYRKLTAKLNYFNFLQTGQNFKLVHSMKQKAATLPDSSIASFWVSKAMFVEDETTKMIEYTDSLKERLKREAGLRVVNEKLEYREEDKDAVWSLFEEKEEGQKFEAQIVSFKRNILSVAPALDSNFKRKIDEIIILSDSDNNINKSFNETFFKNIPAIGALAVIDRFQNEFLTAEN